MWIACVQIAEGRVTAYIMREYLLLWECRCFERVQLGLDKLVQLAQSILRDRLIWDKLRYCKIDLVGKVRVRGRSTSFSPVIATWTLLAYLLKLINKLKGSCARVGACSLYLLCQNSVVFPSGLIIVLAEVLNHVLLAICIGYVLVVFYFSAGKPRFHSNGYGVFF